jgi:hypothetical protein
MNACGLTTLDRGPFCSLTGSNPVGEAKPGKEVFCGCAQISKCCCGETEIRNAYRGTAVLAKGRRDAKAGAPTESDSPAFQLLFMLFELLELPLPQTKRSRDGK